MNDVRFLENRFGGWWCGVKFGKNVGVKACHAARPMRFCEAVTASRISPIVLTADFVNCPGGSRCLGWNRDEKTLAKEIAKKARIEPDVAKQVLLNTPCLPDDPGEIVVGTYEAPDVVISYSRPAAAMKLLRECQKIHGAPLTIQASGFMSVCGAVAVKAYVDDSICISFGCPDAREHGSIGKDRLVIGVPAREVQDLVRRLRAAEVPTASVSSAS